MTGSLRALGAELGVGVGDYSAVPGEKAVERDTSGCRDLKSCRGALRRAQGPGALAPLEGYHGASPCVARQGSPDAGGGWAKGRCRPLTGSGLGSHSDLEAFCHWPHSQEPPESRILSVE